MNFDVFNHVFTQSPIILNQCKDAERLILTDPHDAIVNAREALEGICKSLLPRTNRYERMQLNQMIRFCVNNAVFSNDTNPTIVRECGNKVVHADLTTDYHIANENNIKEALTVVEALFCIVAETSRVTNVRFDKHKIPFGAYDIVRKVGKSPNEVIVGDWHYFVKNANDDYFLLQILPRKSAALGTRNEDARRILKEQYKSQLLNTHNLTVSAQADRQYVLYSVKKDSFLLSENRCEMTPRQAVQVGIDLVKELLEMKEQGIHHRNIQPSSVLLTPVNGMFRADLVNMETTKIEKIDYTIYDHIRDLFSNNLYIPPALRMGEEDSFTEWEKADVYAVAMVMIYSLSAELISESLEPDDLYDRFSDEMVDDVFRPIFESDLKAIFTLDEFIRMLEERMDGEADCR